MIKIHLMLVQE